MLTPPFRCILRDAADMLTFAAVAAAYQPADNMPPLAAAIAMLPPLRAITPADFDSWPLIK